MSRSKSTERRLALSTIRRRIRAGKYTETDLARWVDEVGPEVRELELELRPPAATAKKVEADAKPARSKTPTP